MAKGLGRGFDSLIPTDWATEGFDPTEELDSDVSKLLDIALEKIEPDFDQPRKEFDKNALETLAESVKIYGVLQPIVVTKDGAKYKIVAGERRWRAAKMAGISKIPAIVRTMDGQKRLEMSVIENAQREDLNAIELATAYAKLAEQFNLTTKEIAKRIGKSESAIVNTLRLLNLPEKAKQMMLEHKLSEGVMRPLVAAKEEVVMKILPRIIEEGWTARRVEQYLLAQKPKSSSMVVKEKMYQKREVELEKKYNVRAKIKAKTITFTCKTQEELNKLLERL